MTPDVSIIIPTLGKRQDFLVEAIESCYRAAPRHIVEVLVVFNGSDEHNPTLPAAVSHPSVRISRIEERGANYARNYGLAASGGEFCVFLDDDDWLHDGELSHVIDIMREERLDTCSCSVDVLENDQIREVKRQPSSGDLVAHVLSFSVMPWVLAHVHRRKALPARPWLESIDAAHDQLFLMELCRISALRWSSRPITLGTYRCHVGEKQSVTEGKLGNTLGLYRLEGLIKLVNHLKRKGEMSVDRYKAAREGVLSCAHQILVTYPMKSVLAMGRLCMAEIGDGRWRAAPYWLTRLVLECGLYPFRLAKSFHLFRSR